MPTPPSTFVISTDACMISLACYLFYNHGGLKVGFTGKSVAAKRILKETKSFLTGLGYDVGEVDHPKRFELLVKAHSREKIAVGISPTPVTSEDVRAHASHGMSFAEYWIVAPDFEPDAHLAVLGTRIRLLALGDLRTMFRGQRSGSKAKTKAGKRILSNSSEIVLAVSVVRELIERRRAELDSKRPNTQKGLNELANEIRVLLEMREKANLLVDSIDAFVKDTAQEGEAIKASKGFQGAVRNWWNMRSARVLDKTFDVALVLSAVTACSLMGASPLLSLPIFGVLVGGKDVLGALTPMKKLFG